MKTTVIYHSADYDGIFCREIARKFLGDEGVDYIGWNFGDPPLTLPEGEILVMDLPLGEPFGIQNSVEALGFHSSVSERITWIDHHKTAIESHPKNIKGYRVDGVAACRLAWAWFMSKPENAVPNFAGRRVEETVPSKQDFIERKVSEPQAVRLAGEYDVWDHRGDGDIEFQFGLDSVEQLDWEQLLTLGDRCDGYIGALMLQGRAAMCCYRKRDAEIMQQRSFLLDWEGLKFLALNTARCSSLTFAARDLPTTGHDALMGFYWNGTAWTFSLYQAAHRTDLDLSVIAKKHGGGGHRGACGFTSQSLPWNDFHL